MVKQLLTACAALAVASMAMTAEAAVVKTGGTAATGIVLTSPGIDTPQSNPAYFSGATTIGGDPIASDWTWSTIDGALTPTAIYQFVFDLTGFDVASAVLEGIWGVDNFGTVKLNNNVISELFAEPESNFRSLTSFGADLDALFVAGVNTLIFEVSDGSGPPAAFRAAVRVTATEISEVPLPAALSLFIAGIGGLAFASARRRQIA
ncbi:MAG: VPLPA-CTERM sorting domain-containing protein [Parvularculaceae bacterium]|nr:VPLPA-CTERM sorting domain-containing protein [Parvularculaceae bacterium]